MTSSTDQGPWRAITGTARGAAHVARGHGNQDSVQSQAIEPAGGTVVAVADGHGHDRHFRSAVGSRLATRSACAVIAALAGQDADVPWTAERAGELRGKLPQAIVDEWRSAVASHLAAHPYTADELAALERARNGPEIPYGSTLLVALVAAGWLVCAQIGDGDLVGIRPDGQAWAPVSGDALLDGHRTTSLCQSGAVGSFRTAAYDLRSQPLLALFLGTDGYGNAQASDPWQPQVAGDIAALAAGHDGGWFAEQLPVWAQRCASADGSGDDTTIALLLAPDSRERAAAARLAARPDAVTGPAPPTVPMTAAAAVTVPAPPPAPPWPATVPPPLLPATVPQAPPVPASPPAPPTMPSPAGTAGPPPPRAVAPASGPGRHAAPPPRRSPGRLVIAGVGAVVAAGAITAAVLLSQSSGSGPAVRPDGRPVPKATQTAAPSVTSSVPAKKTAVLRRPSPHSRPPRMA